MKKIRENKWQVFGPPEPPTRSEIYIQMNNSLGLQFSSFFFSDDEFCLIIVNSRNHQRVKSFSVNQSLAVNRVQSETKYISMVKMQNVFI